MRWCLLGLLILQTGCALISGQPGSQEIKPLSRQDWQLLQPHLAELPSPLAGAINTAAQTRISVPPSPSGKEAKRASTTASAILIDLLLYSNEPLLQVDEQFNEIKQIASGRHAPSAPFFAQTLAEYLLNPDFSCQQPIYDRYFQQRYQAQLPRSSCPTLVPFYIVDRQEGGHPLWLDPQRVSSIHLLFGGHGQNMASRFGHVALRLIVCPEGKFDEESCNSNLFEHIVLGYMAHVDEFELDTIKALLGDYKAYLFAAPFMDTYRGYAINEFREIYSLPLILSQEQRQQLVRDLAEIHWSFTDNYNFFTRNCGTLLQQALRGLIPEYGEQPQLSDDYMRPDHFFNAARTSSLTENDRLSSLERAEQQGYYFSSTKVFYEQGLAVVIAAMAQPSFDDLEGYLDRHPGQRLQDIVSDTNYFTLLNKDTYLLEAQIILEELALVRSERLFLAEGSRYFQDLDITSAFDGYKAQLDERQWSLIEDCLLRPVQQVIQPIPRLAGIPDQTTTLPEMKLVADCQTAAARKQLSEILEIINTDHHEQWQRVTAAAHLLDETSQNILILQELTNDSLSH